MTTEILNGQPPQPADEALLKAYHDAVIRQADLYVDLAKELLKLELAIPGIYAAALKLVPDQSPHALLVAAAFGCWLLALLATLRALFPHRYEVLHDAVQRVGRAESAGPLTIEEFFQQSAQDKRRWLLGAVPLFFAGIAAAAAAVLV